MCFTLNCPNYTHTHTMARSFTGSPPTPNSAHELPVFSVHLHPSPAGLCTTGNYNSQVPLLPASGLVEAIGSSGRRLWGSEDRRDRVFLLLCFLWCLPQPLYLFCGSGSFWIVPSPVVHIPPVRPHLGAPATSPSSGLWWPHSSHCPSPRGGGGFLWWGISSSCLSSPSLV